MLCFLLQFLKTPKKLRDLKQQKTDAGLRDLKEKLKPEELAKERKEGQEQHNNNASYICTMCLCASTVLESFPTPFH